MPTVETFNVCTHAIHDSSQDIARPTPAVIDFHPQKSLRFATGGGDNNVSIWQLSSMFETGIEQLAKLVMHTKCVNAIQWHPKGDVLASAADDGVIAIWSCIGIADASAVPRFGETVADKEIWKIQFRLRDNLGELSDLRWDGSGERLVVSSLNGLAVIFDVSKRKAIQRISMSGQFVQGLTWDTCLQTNTHYLAIQCANSTTKLYKQKNKKFAPIKNLTYFPMPKKDAPQSAKGNVKKQNMFPSNIVTLSRRPVFSTDNLFLCAVAGQTPLIDNKTHSAIHLFHRSNFSQKVSSYIFVDSGCVCCVAFNPILFETDPDWISDAKSSLSAKYKLKYKMIFAAISGSSVFVFDTNSTFPVFYWHDEDTQHFVDLSWSADGKQLLIADCEGFLSVITFKGDFGSPLQSK